MTSAVELLSSLSEETIRAVHAGDMTRDELSEIGEEEGFGASAGVYTHKWIRGHKTPQVLIDVYVRQNRHTETGADSPAVRKIEGNVVEADLDVLYPHGEPMVRKAELMERLGLNELDEEEWEIEGGRIGQWGGQMKVGEKGDESLVYTNQYKGEVRFQRKERQPQFPEPQEVHVHLPPAGLANETDTMRPDGWETALLYTDPHYGFRRIERTGDLIPVHDRHAIDLVKQVAQRADIDRVCCLGDMIDAPAISDYTGTPDLTRTLQPSLLEASYDIGQIRHAAEPEAFDWIEGNHDERVRETLLDSAPELYGIRDVDAIKENRPPQLSLRSLMRLDEKGVTWHGDYPDSELRLNSGLSLAHDWTLGSRSGQTTYKMLRDQHGEISRIQGHGHRHERADFTNWEGQDAREYFAAMLGCLSRLDGVVEGVKARQNWQQSFALAHYDPSGWQHVLEPVKVYSARKGDRRRECWFRGDRLRSRAPDLEALSEATGWRFTLSERVAVS